MSKISQLPSITSIDTSADYVVIVDTSENKTKKATVSQVSSVAPSGTGFRKIVSGVEQAAAEPVDLADGTERTGTLPVGNGGTGLTALGTAGQVLRVNSGVSANEYATLPAGSTDEIQTKSATAGQFTAATNVKAGSNFISVGTSPATTNDGLRLAKGAKITIRDDGDTANVGVYEFNAPASAQHFGYGSGSAYFGNQLGSGSWVQCHSGAGFVTIWGANTLKATFEANGIQIGAGTGDFGGGVGAILGIDNAGTNPSTNPTGGGILYSDAGAGKWRGSGGTVTTFGPAEPHCPTCGRDFALEHRNDDMGEHFALCLPCLVDALVTSGVDTSRFLITDKRGSTKAAWDQHVLASNARVRAPREPFDE